MKHFSFSGLLVLAATLIVGSASAQTTPGTAAPAFRIGRIALAATKVDSMVNFYRNVFSINFSSFDVGGGIKVYSGKLAGIDFMLAPNQLANVRAEQSRVQFDIIVPNIADIKAKAKASGGAVREENEQGGRLTATLVDPDGNTIMVVQEKK